MNNDQFDQIEQLRDTLHRDARHIEPVALGVENVQKRGRRRQHRGRAIVAAGAATCIAGLGVAVAQRGPAPHSVAVAGHVGAATPTPTLSFRTVSGTVAYSQTHFTSAAGVTYALATAPGTGANDNSEAIYRTTDGANWTETTQSSPWISDLTEHDGVLYAVGTAPGATNVNDVKYELATSHDNGAGWSDSDLPFDLQPPSASVPISRSSSVQVAHGATSTVALLTEQFTPDLSALIAARAPGHPNAETRQTANGFDIVDYSACESAKAGSARGLAAVKQADALGKAERVPSVGATCTTAPTLGTISWSDIGVSGAAALDRQQILVSTDGSHWDSVDGPSTGWVQDLVASSDGFLLLDQRPDPATADSGRNDVTVYHSTDARTWTAVAAPAGINVQGIDGDRIIGTDQPGGTIETSADGGATWQTTTVQSALPPGTPQTSVWVSDVGPLGFAAVASTASYGNSDAVQSFLLFSTDGVNWKTSTLDTSGIPAGVAPFQVTVGADHVGVDYESAGAIANGPMKLTTLLGTPQR